LVVQKPFSKSDTKAFSFGETFNIIYAVVNCDLCGGKSENNKELLDGPKRANCAS